LIAAALASGAIANIPMIGLRMGWTPRLNVVREWELFSFCYDRKDNGPSP